MKGAESGSMRCSCRSRTWLGWRLCEDCEAQFVSADGKDDGKVNACGSAASVTLEKSFYANM